MDNTEDRYLNRSDFNIQDLLKEKKYAKILNIFAFIGFLAGLSASLVFYIKYDLILTPLIALTSSKLIFKILIF